MCVTDGATASCRTTCTDGQTCDSVSHACVSPTCEDFCGSGAACVAGACVPVAPCNPGCSAGTACQDGSCVPILAAACPGGCGPCQVCVTAGDTAACATTCDVGMRCDQTAGSCVVDNVHVLYLQGPYTRGEDVTEDCLGCHQSAADQMLRSAHYRWAGPTPGLVDRSGVPVDTGNVGKAGLINNFCVATPSNEGRCAECHAGYGDAAAKKAAYQLSSEGRRVDCLICHADLATGYIKAVKNFGVADVKPASGCLPACPATDVCTLRAGAPVCVPYATRLPEVLKAAAQSVRRPGRDNCGKCHFYAGGGDNVKMGDLASSLAVPAGPAVDVHMGSTNATAPRTCADCHAGTGFAHDRFKGTGVSLALVQEAPLQCTGCHAAQATAHPAPTTFGNHDHSARVACQVCHIPQYARQLTTKTMWDWSLAGFKDCKYPGAPAEIIAACVLDPTSPAFGTARASIGGDDVDYNWQKGVFHMRKNVEPAYRWYDGSGTHLTIAGAAAAFDPADGLSPSRPVTLAGPVAAATDTGAVVTAFKRMIGRQAMMLDGSFVVVPHLFGAWSLWGTKPDPTVQPPAPANQMIPVLPATTTSPTAAKYGSYATYAAFLDAVWNDIMSSGAATAGQLTPLFSVPVDAMSASADTTEPTRTRVTVTVTHALTVGDRFNLMSADLQFPPGIKVVAAADGTTLQYLETARPAPLTPVRNTAATRGFRALVRGVDWDWRHTDMYMNLNHEVMPRGSALSTCTECHSGTGRMCEAYADVPAGSRPFGVAACP
ncbi:MAG: hypothetical protein HY904_22780 [Deltaproteobacteria bacterium]|nr:hypothetical protein [Deltaproteobacteria bacterium]